VKTLDVLASVLPVVGGLNWGLWGAFEVDVVALPFGGNATGLSKIILAVGKAALYQAWGLRAIQRRWDVAPARA